jgi:dsRNA-specific ribonuclease
VNERKNYVEEYRKRVTEAVERPDAHNLRLINEVEPPELQEVEVPKVLGDVFEALIGGYFYSLLECTLFR